MDESSNQKYYNGITEYPMNLLAPYCSENWRDEKQYSWCWSDTKRQWRDPRKLFDLSDYTVRRMQTLLPSKDSPTIVDAVLYEKRHGWFGRHFGRKKDYVLEVQIENDSVGKSSLVFTNMSPDKFFFGKDELSYGKGKWYKPK